MQRRSSNSEASAAADEWEVFWSSMCPIELAPDVERVAGELAVRHRLRGADASHLARALALGLPELTVAMWDKRRHAGAAAAGFPAAPSTLD